MKILLVSNMYPSFKYPHYGVFVKNSEDVINKMPDTKVDKIVLNKMDHKIEKLLKYLIFYICIIFKGIFGGYDLIYGHFASHIALPILVVHLLNKKVKIITNIHGNDAVPEQKKDEKWIPLVIKLLKISERVIVPSEYFRSILILKYKYPIEKIVIFPSGGVNLSVFHPMDREPLIKKYNLDGNKHYIGFISRIEKNKGWDLFLELVKKLKDRQDLGFIIVGSGTEEHILNDYIKANELSACIKKFGFLKQTDIAEIFNVLDVFCLPSYRKSESFGLVGLEAMACGNIVVVPDKGGPASYVIDKKNGYMFLMKNKKSFIETVTYILNISNKERQFICENAIKTSIEYDINRIGSILVNLFEKYR